MWEGDRPPEELSRCGASARTLFCAGFAPHRRQALELRATRDLARLWHDQGRHRDACALLEPAFGWFTEGFETADLRATKALLDELTCGV
jgi:predicted ATPase